jgi:Domain of unknown function (DUF4252)
MHKWMLIASMALATSANAQQVDLKSLDKFFSLAKNVTQLNLDESMIKSATNALNDKKNDEAAAKKAASDLKGLYLRVFEFDRKGVYKFDDLKSIRDQLKGPDWTVFLQNRETDEQTEIWVHKTKGMADGIVLIAAEAEELVVINALGIGQVNDLSKIGGQFGIPQIGGKSSGGGK